MPIDEKPSSKYRGEPILFLDHWFWCSLIHLIVGIFFLHSWLTWNSISYHDHLYATHFLITTYLFVKCINIWKVIIYLRWINMKKIELHGYMYIYPLTYQSNYVFLFWSHNRKWMYLDERLKMESDNNRQLINSLNQIPCQLLRMYCQWEKYSTELTRSRMIRVNKELKKYKPSKRGVSDLE